MGLDFLQRTAPSFKKSVSRDAAAVARMGAQVLVDANQQVLVADGDIDPSWVEKSLVVQLVGSELSVVDGLHEIGRIHSVPPSVLDALVSLGGFAEGHIAHVNSLGGTFDVSLH